MSSKGRLGRSAKPTPPPAVAAWAACGLGATLAGLGVIFLSRPPLAARLFGLPTHDRTGYVRALGVRDLALAAGLAAAACGSRRQLSTTSALAALIPAGDMILVGRARAASARAAMALHGLSLVALAATALLASRPAPRRQP